MTLNQINENIVNNPRGFIEQCEEEYAQKIRDAAWKIRANLKNSPIVLLSGPSSSGKTTTSLKIERVLEEMGIECHPIATDNYFKTLDPATAPRTPEGELDFESPLCLDADLLDEHFTKLSRGEEIQIPYFDFPKQRRSPDITRSLKLHRNEVAIFEGIHTLNDDIAGRHPEAFKMYISARTDVVDEAGQMVFDHRWIRLIRRCVRDAQFRGASVAETLNMWDNVLRGEQLYVAPFRSKADLVFATALPYELPILNKIASPLLAQVERREYGFGSLDTIAHALAAFTPMGPELVPEDSLLREFIGGGNFDYH